MLDFNSLPTYTPPDKDHITGYVYFLFQNEHLVYIGQTVNLDSRLGEHKAKKKFTHAKYIKVGLENLDEMEKMYISHYTPIYNTSHVPKKSPMFVQVDGNWVSRKTHIGYKFNNGVVIYDNCFHGYYNDDFISILYYPHISCKYNRNTHEYIESRVDSNEHFEWDLSSFSFIKKDGSRYSNSDEKKILPDGYVFWFGKYSGMSVDEVKEFNENYITWFSENIPKNKWIKEYAPSSEEIEKL